MPLLPNILLGVLGGQLMTRAVYDHIWWSHLGADPSTLKSKVTAMQRQESLSFYRHVAQQPSNFTYLTIVIVSLILISTLGQTIVNQRRRVMNLLSFLTFSGCVIVYAAFVLPIFQAITKHVSFRAKADVEAKWLYDIAFYHGLIAVGWMVTLFLQSSVAEEEEQRTVKKSVKKTS
ncbi:hypothetical protein PhCBS80983_g02224 [Powellomyces hirtus]|uniref:Uncharacterized protein n=1 Tax=Powellomyces hirtus TaxID=109895 RepID=A0A507E7U6_9FUNG|nr:hypothetical protein PhCBS80983_g02224 [Powellomyces hirtus]